MGPINNPFSRSLASRIRVYRAVGGAGEYNEEVGANAWELLDEAADTLDATTKALAAIVKVATYRWRALPVASHEKTILAEARAALEQAGKKYGGADGA